MEMPTIDYVYNFRKGKLLVSIADTQDDLCECSPIRLKFVQVPDKDDLVKEYIANYTYREVYDICPVFAALDELYGTLAKKPRVRIYDSHVSVRWSYYGINIAYKIKLKLEPVGDHDFPLGEHGNGVDRDANLESRLADTELKLQCAMSLIDKLNIRLAELELAGIR